MVHKYKDKTCIEWMDVGWRHHDSHQHLLIAFPQWETI